MEKKPILLVGFYNTKALGVRYLETALIKSGYTVYTLFLKEFDSKNPGEVTETELQLVKKLVADLDPGLIGLSVMSSLYIGSVIKVNKVLRDNFNIPIVWGGVYATLFPDKAIEHADFVLRGEGEDAIAELADAILGSKPYSSIRNLVYREQPNIHSDIRSYVFHTQDHDSGRPYEMNGLRPLCESLDNYGYPLFGLKNKYLIDSGRIINEDPLTHSLSYETSASRGCPFSCSYCSSANLRRLYARNGKYVRVRSVESVINELRGALSHMKRLMVIRFWDEIFPNDKDWVDKFTYEYKTNIRLPFEIWGHPLKTDDYAVMKLVDAGLYKVVMGIQSGSPSIRREIFHRRETQEDIMNAGRILSGRNVPHVVYDFMLRHPFETEEDIRLTYEICANLPKPFELQLHGLNFLPGTDIINIAVKKKVAEADQLEEGFSASLGEQYKAYWRSDCKNKMIDFWYSLIYISQFRTGLYLSKFFSKNASSRIIQKAAPLFQILYYPEAKARYLRKKAIMIIRACLANAGLKTSEKRTMRLSKKYGIQ